MTPQEHPEGGHPRRLTMGPFNIEFTGWVPSRREQVSVGRWWTLAYLIGMEEPQLIFCSKILTDLEINSVRSGNLQGVLDRHKEALRQDLINAIQATAWGNTAV